MFEKNPLTIDFWKLKKSKYFFLHALPFENLYLLWQKDDAKNKLQHTHTQWGQSLYKVPFEFI